MPDSENISYAELEAIAFTCIINTLQDESTWQTLGFRRLPKRGTFFNMFVKNEILQKEDTVRQELLCVSIAQVTLWLGRNIQGYTAVLLTARVLEMVVDGIDHALWQVYGFSNRTQAIDFLSDGVNSYVRVSKDKLGANFLVRTLQRVPDSDRNSWFTGVVKLFNSPESIFYIIPMVLDKMVGKKQQYGKISVQDSVFIPNASHLIKQVINKNAD